VTQGLASSLPLHREVVRAIIDGRPDAAREAMRALIEDATQDMEAVLAEMDHAEGPRPARS
jgi:DNA-binding FadR family transcriptional regulator